MGADARKFMESLFDGFRQTRGNGEDVSSLLENAKNEIREIRANIDNVNDDLVLDMYIYRLKAAEAQYKHLLKMAKERSAGEERSVKNA